MMEKQNDAEVVKAAAGDADAIDEIIDSANGVGLHPRFRGAPVMAASAKAKGKSAEEAAV